MLRIASSGLVMAIALGAAVPAAAQNTGIEFTAFVSANKPVQGLNDVPSATFKTGFGGGVGVGYVLEKNLAIRGDISFAKSDISHANLGSALISDSWSRIMIGGDVVLRLPLESGIMPYFSTGGGAIRFSESGGRTPTRAAGRFGAGIKFPIGDKVGLYAQGNAWVYDFDQKQFTYFTMVQIDMAFSAGVSVRF